MAVGAWAWAPRFPVVDQSVHFPIDRTLLPPIAAYTSAWALYAAFLVRARRAHKRGLMQAASLDLTTATSHAAQAGPAE